MDDLDRRRRGRYWFRKVNVRIGVPGEDGLQFDESFRIAANVVRTKRRKPNKATLRLWNLSSESAEAVQQGGNSIVLAAGYAGDVQTIFTGNIDEATIKPDGDGITDVVLEITAADARSAYQKAAVYATYASKIETPELLQRMIADAGLRASHLPLESTYSPVQYPFGFTAADAFKDVFTQVCDDAGLEWSFQSGEVVVTPIGEPVERRAVVVSASAGNLIGRVEKLKKGKGVKFRALLTGSLRPKALLRLESADATGFFVPSKVTYTLDSGFDTPFYAEVEAKQKG